MKIFLRRVTPTGCACIGLLGAALFFVVIGSRLDFDAAFFPVTILVAISALSIILFFQEGLFKASDSAVKDLSVPIGKVLLGILFTAIYVLAVHFIGFFFSTFIMIPIVSKVFGYQCWSRSIICSSVFTIMLYLLFEIAMGRSLPHGLLI
ncbi:tripartite tricarboxylate transporter TctB family protein [Halomonas sp. AOP12-C2-37]|uniref:tripartite tricarboxylate transporter TctB family protein n=1 Tax=unclassified Halomonas TaxID=2609666 RepID=UPI0040344A69